MILDIERIERKIAYIREQINTITKIIKTCGEQDIFQDPLKLSGLKYLLQTSIEAMIDIAYHVAAKEFCYPPNDARDALKVLMEKGVISASEFDTYVAMVGLRNRLVHGYERVSAEVLYEVVTKQLDYF